MKARVPFVITYTIFPAIYLETYQKNDSKIIKVW